MGNDETNLTADEANLYDRQIRLWGVEAQSRLRSSSVLLVGLNLLGAEIAKNLTLSGIKSLDIIDDRILAETDEENFLIPQRENAVGSKISEAALTRCRELNPLVDIRCLECECLDENSPPEKRIDLAYYDLVCLIDADRSLFDLDRIKRLNSDCRKIDVKFVASGCFGFFAYCFFDFQNFEYYQEVGKNGVLLDKAETSEPEAKRIKIEEVTPEKSLSKRVENFVSFEEATKPLTIDQESRNKFRKLPGGFYQFQIVNKFYDESKTKANISDEDVDRLQIIYETLVRDWSSCLNNSDFDIPRFLPKKIVGLPSPVCAIMGGVVSQQIIQALSQNEQPINNFVFYDGHDCSVCKLPVN